jgi:cyanate permease
MYLIAIVIGIGATISGPITYARVINGWFDRNRGLALGLVLSASPAIATAVAVQVSQRSIDAEGWRNTIRMLAIVAAAVTIPTALLLVREAPVRNTDGAPLEAAEGLASGRALRSRDFLLLIATSSLAVGALMGTTAHFLAWMAERGIPKQVGTSALSLYSLAGPLGPLVGGYLVDRLESPRIVAGFFALPLIGIYLLMYGSRAAIIPGMIALGLAFSSINGFVPYLVSRYFGMRSISEILGVTFAALTVAMGLGPVLMGIGHDHFGGYRWPMAIAAGLATLTLGGSLCFGPYRYRAAKSPP